MMELKSQQPIKFKSITFLGTPYCPNKLHLLDLRIERFLVKQLHTVLYTIKIQMVEHYICRT